jgi:hypothetical protein
MKLKWKVAEAPTGRYRSFSHRGWPSATYPNGDYAGGLYCEDDYTPARARGEVPHRPITVQLKLLSKTPEDIKKYGTWRSVRMKVTFATLKEAKEAMERWCTIYPQMRVEEKPDSKEDPSIK